MYSVMKQLLFPLKPMHHMKTCQCAVDVARVGFHCSIISDRVMPCKESIGEFRDWQPDWNFARSYRLAWRAPAWLPRHRFSSHFGGGFCSGGSGSLRRSGQASDLEILSTCFTEAGAVS